MTDYTRQLSGGSTHFGDKDELSSGDPEKVIVGTQFDTEFNAIVTHSATKYDVTDLASAAQAADGLLNTVLMTPLRTENWADTWKAENAGIIGDLHALADPGADSVLAWNDTTNAGVALTMSAAFEIDTGAFELADAVAGDGIDIAAQVLSLTDITAGANQPISLSGTTWDFDITALDTVEGNAVDDADAFIVDVGGVTKELRFQDWGVTRVQDTTATPLSTPVLTMANKIFDCDFATAITATIPANATVAFPIGTIIGFTQMGAGTVTVAVTTDTLISPGGLTDTRVQYSTIFARKTDTTTWVLSGDLG